MVLSVPFAVTVRTEANVTTSTGRACATQGLKGRTVRRGSVLRASTASSATSTALATPPTLSGETEI